MFLSFFTPLYSCIKAVIYTYWDSLSRQTGAWEYIEKTRDMVHDLEKRVQAAKNNVESMSQLMTKWCEAPLYERKEGKKEGLLNLEVNVRFPFSVRGFKGQDLEV